MPSASPPTLHTFLAVVVAAAAALALSTDVGSGEPSAFRALVAQRMAAHRLPPIQAFSSSRRRETPKRSMRSIRRSPERGPDSSHSPPRSLNGSVKALPEADLEPQATGGVTADLKGWSTAGVGEVLPQAVAVPTPVGESAVRVLLTASQHRSELILGGNGTPGTGEVVEFEEGDEYWFGYSFAIEQMTWGHPGAHNLIMQFKTEGEGSPQFGLQLWDWKGHRGLWSHGEAMDGDRFLSPISEGDWHVVMIHFRASAAGAGAYRVFLDGNLVDERAGVSMIAPGSRAAYIKVGLYRNGDTNPGTSELLIDSTKLGLSPEVVQPG